MTQHRLAAIAPLFAASIALHGLAGYQYLVGTFEKARLPHLFRTDLAQTVGFILVVSAPFVFGPLLRRRPPRPLFSPEEVGRPRSLLATVLYAPILIFTGVLVVEIARPGGIANLIAGAIMLWLLLNGRAIQAGE